MPEDENKANEAVERIEFVLSREDTFSKLNLRAEKNARDARIRKTTEKLKLTRNQFCENVLGAKLTNSRWGWVGAKEGRNGEQGSLYLFGWEHNKGRDGENTVGLFHKNVGVDAKGRRRPGHRDALEKIERVITGELKPYIVWQTAADPTAAPKTIESINGGYVSSCELYIDDKGYWTAKLLDQISLTNID